MVRLEDFQLVLDQVYAALQQESWFKRADNYVIELDTEAAPVSGRHIVLATTTRGGGVPTKIVYYLRNIHSVTYDELYRITKHEFAHLWGLDEADAQSVE